MQTLVTEVEILTASLSDHAPVITTLTIPPIHRPIRHWRLHDTLLHKATVVEQIQKAIQEYLTHNANSDTTLATQWTALKAFICGEFVAISMAENAERSQKRAELTQQVHELEQMHQRTGAPRIGASFVQHANNSPP